MSTTIQQLDAESLTVPYGEKGSPERAAYGPRIAEIQRQVRETLAAEYASDYTPEQQDLIWAKAYEDGHANGYSEIEYHYRDLVEFLDKFRN